MLWERKLLLFVYLRGKTSRLGNFPPVFVQTFKIFIDSATLDSEITRNSLIHSTDQSPGVTIIRLAVYVFSVKTKKRRNARHTWSKRLPRNVPRVSSCSSKYKTAGKWRFVYTIHNSTFQVYPCLQNNWRWRVRGRHINCPLLPTHFARKKKKKWISQQNPDGPVCPQIAQVRAGCIFLQKLKGVVFIWNFK